MTRSKWFLVAALAFGIVALLSATAASGGPAKAKTGDTDQTRMLELRVQPWHLLQNSGAEIYGELCGSCHGVDGGGDGPAATALEIPAPALNRLRRAGIEKRHWTYVIESPCEDRHHRAPSGAGTMPCWKRIFREALGNDSAALLVSAKLVDHLESIQE